MSTRRRHQTFLGMNLPGVSKGRTADEVVSDLVKDALLYHARRGMDIRAASLHSVRINGKPEDMPSWAIGLLLGQGIALSIIYGWASLPNYPTEKVIICRFVISVPESELEHETVGSLFNPEYKDELSHLAANFLT